MSYANRVLTAMKTNVFYRPCDLAGDTKLETSEVKKILDMLTRGGLVDSEEGHGYKRKKIYKTRQRSLF